jgi:hypothetical protein
MTVKDYVERNIRLMTPEIKISKFRFTGNNLIDGEYYDEQEGECDMCIYWQDINSGRIYYDWGKMIEEFRELLE